MHRREPMWKRTGAFRRTQGTARFFDFLKRHKQALSIVSAVVVFMSFTLKEELGEHVKDELTTVQNVIDKVDKLITDENEGIGKINEHRELDEILAIVRGEKYIAPEVPMALLSFGHEIAILHIFDSISVRRQYYEEQEHAIHLEVEELRHQPMPDRETKMKFGIQMDERIRRVGALVGEARGEVFWRRSMLQRELQLTKWGVYVLFLLGWMLGLTLTFVGDKPSIGG